MTDHGTLLAKAVDPHTDRFDYQRQASFYARDHMTGPILNVGCKEDPAHLKYYGPDRVVNCDMCAHDELHDQPNKADVLFDCARDRWPFEDSSAAMVIMGDILEHLNAMEIVTALAEARRVGQSLCVTTPHDTEVDLAFAAKWSRGVRHVTCFTAGGLSDAASGVGWNIVHLRAVDYVFLPIGFLMCCV